MSDDQATDRVAAGVEAAPALEAASAAVSPVPVAPGTSPQTSSRLLKGLFFFALIALLDFAQPLLVPVAVAVILTFVLTPPVRWLRRHGIPEVLGSALLVGALIVAALLLGSVLVEPAVQWLDKAPSTMARLTERVDRVRARIPGLEPPPKPVESPAARVESRSAPIPNVRPAPAPAPPPDPVKEKIASESVALTGAVLGGTLTFAVSAAATVILLFFLLASEYWMLSRSVEAIPRRRTRALVLSGVRCAQVEISQFLGALAVINLVVGVATGVAMHFIGIANPVLWGSLAAGLNFIPYIGPMIMSGLLLVAGLLTFDGAGMLVPPAAFLLIHAIESNFATPWFVGRRLSLSPVSVFLSVMFWGWLWGIAGAVIAVPLLVVMRSVCKRNRRWRLLCVYLEGDRDDVPSLRSLVRIRRHRAAAPR
jgi:predicted PurR-regulated permease PerM